MIPITFFNSITIAEDEEVYLQAISDQIQVITKDLKTLEKAVYQKSDIASSTTLNLYSFDTAPWYGTLPAISPLDKSNFIPGGNVLVLPSSLVSTTL